MRDVTDDVDATLAVAERNGGGRVVMPKAGGGEHGSVAQFEDSEGNLAGLYSSA